MRDSVNLYTVYDLIAEEPGPIFQAVNDGVAGRKMQQIMETVKHKEDFVLYRIGYFTKSMEIIPELHIVDLYQPMEVEANEEHTLQES